MIKAFLDIGCNVSLLVTLDRYIAVYEEVDYSVKLLDFIYSKLNGIGVQELVIVLHGNLGLGADGVSILGAKADESRNDYDALGHLASTLGISKLSFYEFASYGFYNLPHNYLVVFQSDASYKLVVYKDSIVKIVDCAEDTLQQNVISLCNTYELKGVRDASFYTAKELLGYYKNVNSVYAAILPKLSMFAFMQTKDCGAIEILDTDVCRMTQAPPIVEQQSVTFNEGDGQIMGNVEPINDDLTKSRPKRSKAAKVKPVKEKSPKDSDSGSSVVLKVLSFFKLPVILLLLLFLIISIIGNIIIGKKLASEQNTLKEITSEYNNVSKQLSAYNRLSDSSDTSLSASAVDILSSIDYSQATSSNISLDGDDLKISLQFTSKTAASKFKSSITANNAVVNVAKRGSNYICDLSINV